MLAAGDGLLEVLTAAAEADIGPGGHQLLGDRALAAVVDGVARALLEGLLGALAVPIHHMGGEHGRGGVLQLRGGDVSGGKSLLLHDLEDRVQGLAVEVDRDGAVVGLGPGRPPGAGGRRVGHVVRLALLGTVFGERERGVLAGDGQCVESGKGPGGAVLVVAR